MTAVGERERLPVLVVGAGPTGLVLAGELRRRGIAVRLVDKATTPTDQSRAIAVHARTLEIFDELGIASALVARGVPAEGVTMMSGGVEIANLDFAGLPTKFPFALCVSQVETEAVLTELLHARGGEVERGRELVSFAERDDAIEATVRSEAGEEIIRAAFVVGCDGSHSAVRHQVGAKFEGYTYEETFVLADVRIEGEGAPASNRMTTFFADDGIAALFPMKDRRASEGPARRFRVIVTAPKGTVSEAPTLEEVRALVIARAGHDMPIRDAVWIAPFRIHCRQVARYRHGRAFLAGDAAHIHSPVGGQGMNTGIQDAHNLAWKLALVLRGEAKPVLLDSYQAERHAIGRFVLAETDRATKIGMLKGMLAPVRDQVARVVSSFDLVRQRLLKDTAELTVGYEKSPIAREVVTSALIARFGRPEAAESPTVGSRFAFGSTGPKAGARAPDAPLLASDGSRTSVAELLGGEAFTLLLCDGRSPTDLGYARMVRIAATMKERWPTLVRTYLVTPQTTRPAAVPADITLVHDEGELERTYGAQTECLYLIRPDLYVGFRSQPADGDALVGYLEDLLV